MSDMRAEDVVRSAVRAIAAPAVAVSVVSMGKVVFQFAHGEADGVPCDSKRTMFPTASISKTVVATLAAQCAERDELDLDADISTEYLIPAGIGTVRNPHFLDAPVTCRMLLMHRAGLRDDEGGLKCGSPYRSEGSDWGGDGEGEHSLCEYVRQRLVLNGSGGGRHRHNAAQSPSLPPKRTATEDTTLWCKSDEPGLAAYHYSNAGVTLAGLVIAIAAQRPLSQLATERIFSPLGMQHTSFTLAAARKIGAPIAVPHVALPGGDADTRAVGHYGVAEWPAAQMRSSAGDVGLFLAALSSGPSHCPLFRTPRGYQMMLPPPANNGGEYRGALAWWGVDTWWGGAGSELWRGGRCSWAHGGFMEGVRSHAYLWPATHGGLQGGRTLQTRPAHGAPAYAGASGECGYCGAVVLTNGESCYGTVTAALKRLLGIVDD